MRWPAVTERVDRPAMPQSDPSSEHRSAAVESAIARWLRDAGSASLLRMSAPLSGVRVVELASFRSSTLRKSRFVGIIMSARP